MSEKHEEQAAGVASEEEKARVRFLLLNVFLPRLGNSTLFSALIHE